MNFWIARTAYNTSRYCVCPYFNKDNLCFILCNLLGHRYPMEPVGNLQFCIHSESVQEMCRKCVTPTARFLVIAAPRPSGYQTWMNPGGTNRGALFLWR